MRLRPPGERRPYTISHSDLFEASYYALERQFPNIAEAYDALEWALTRQPLAESEPAPAFPGREIRLTLTPKMTRYPGLRVLIEVDEIGRRVHLWSLSQR